MYVLKISEFQTPKKGSFSLSFAYYVLVQPAIDKSKELGKAASKTGVKGELTCKAEGNPVVNFQWRKVS